MSSIQRQPYIGITDFTDFAQVGMMLKVLREHRKARSGRMLHVGVMTSYKTLNGIQSRWSGVFPPIEQIGRIFHSTVNRVYNCLHYADYSFRTGYADLARAIELAGPYIDAIQLDMPWPEPAVIAEGVHASRRQIDVILQIGKGAIEEANNDPDEVVRHLEEYEGIIHRVLLDKSMGQGLEMNAEELLPFLRAIKEAFPDIALGVAGGLGPNSMGLVAPLIDEFPDLSIDAQGRLRPSGNALDPIDWKMAESYLIQALDILP